MKKTFLLLCTASALLSSCDNKNTTTTADVTKDTTASTTVANEEKKTRVMPDSATMMQNWMAYRTPGPMHQALAATNGNWTGETTMWTSPDAAPSTTTLQAHYTMVMGGRYQVATHKGSMMGMEFEGTSTTGYDNAKKKLVNTWIDNSGTGIMYMEGTWDDASKTATYIGKCVASEMGDGSEMGVKQVMAYTDASHHTMVMYMIGDDGSETKTMEIKYSKK